MSAFATKFINEKIRSDYVESVGDYTDNTNHLNCNSHNLSDVNGVLSSKAPPFGPQEPFWFSMTVVFIYLASFLRLCQLSLKEILWKYLAHKQQNGRRGALAFKQKDC